MNATPRRTVLVTGATGYIASQLLPTFRERYDLRLVDVRDTDRSGQPVSHGHNDRFELRPRTELHYDAMDLVAHCRRRESKGFGDFTGSETGGRKGENSSCLL